MKKKIALLLIVLLAIISIPVQAKTEDNFITGDDISIEKSIGSTTFVAANTIDVNSDIDGIIFAAGNSIRMSSKQDYAFVAGNNITLDKFSAKDAFIAGSVITLKEATVRDLYVSGGTIKVDGVVSHNAYLAADTIIINAKVNGDLYVAAEKIKIGENAVINGTLKYPEEVTPEIHKNAIVTKKKTYKGDIGNTEKNYSLVNTFIIAPLMSYVSMLLIALILLALNKKLFERMTKFNKKTEELLKVTGIGFLGLIAIPIISIIAICTLIGMPLGFIGFIIYGVLIYLSAIPTSYCLGNYFLKDKIKNKYLLLTVSLLMIYILKNIPFVGGFVGLISCCLGLGMYLVMIKESFKTK